MYHSCAYLSVWPMTLKSEAEHAKARHRALLAQHYYNSMWRCLACPEGSEQIVLWSARWLFSVWWLSDTQVAHDNSVMHQTYEFTSRSACCASRKFVRNLGYLFTKHRRREAHAHHEPQHNNNAPPCGLRATDRHTARSSEHRIEPALHSGTESMDLV